MLFIHLFVTFEADPAVACWGGRSAVVALAVGPGVRGGAYDEVADNLLHSVVVMVVFLSFGKCR